MRPHTEGVLETSLYVSDLEASRRFYEEVFGFRLISDLMVCQRLAHLALNP